MDMEFDLLCEKFISGEVSKDNFIDELKRMRAFSKSDRFKLKVVDSAPFSMWACDEEFIICYWECQCERIYGYSSKEALGKRFLELFVAAPERNQAEIECTKIIEGRSAPGEFINNIAVDFDSLGRDVTLMTNCFRIFDEESQKWLQAEIALPTDVKKVVQKHADILRSYQKLRSMIAQYENDNKSFLDSVSVRIKELTAITRKILNSRRKDTLSQEDIERLGGLEYDISETNIKITCNMKEKLTSIQQAKSIDQCLLASHEFAICKNKCTQLIDDIQNYLDDIVDELKVNNISIAAALSQTKKEAIIDCDAESNTLILRLNGLIQVAFDASFELSFDGIDDDIPRQKADLYTSYSSDVQKLLASAKSKISECTSEAQIKSCRSSFKHELHKIEEMLDTYEGKK